MSLSDFVRVDTEITSFGAREQAQGAVLNTVSASVAQLNDLVDYFSCRKTANRIIESSENWGSL